MADNERDRPSKDRYNGKSSGPPILENDGVNFVNWRIKAEVWCETETGIKRCKKAPKIFVALPDRAFEHTKHIPLEVLKSKEGVKTLLDKLAELYIPDKLGDRIKQKIQLYNKRRKPGECVIKHIEEYMKIFREYRMLCTHEYDDSDLAIEIMASCDLTEADTKTVSAQMEEPPSSANVIQILKRIFSMTNQEKYNKEKSDSDTLLAKASQIKHDNSHEDARDSHSTFYERGRNRKISRPWDKNKRQKPWDKPWDKNQRGRTKNKAGRDGRVMTCIFCESQWHLMADCEELAKLKREQKKERHNGKDVHLSMITFVGCASQNKSDEKLNTLINDSEGYALLDSGCSNTVAGEKWVTKYVASLSNNDKSKIKYMPSEESFTFGDGKTHKATRKINFPCWVGGKSADITADIVDCKIPLLLSRKAMTKAEMVIDFGNHTADINGRKINLKRTDSGHYALPINL